MLETIGGILILYLTYKQFTASREDKVEEDKKEQFNTNTELELKVKELEGRIATQYGELSTKLTNLERSITEGKTTNHAFETRILANLDKLDSKLERTQELLLRSMYNLNQPNKNEK